MAYAICEDRIAAFTVLIYQSRSHEVIEIKLCPTDPDFR